MDYLPPYGTKDRIIIYLIPAQVPSCRPLFPKISRISMLRFIAGYHRRQRNKPHNTALFPLISLASGTRSGEDQAFTGKWGILSPIHTPASHPDAYPKGVMLAPANRQLVQSVLALPKNRSIINYKQSSGKILQK